MTATADNDRRISEEEHLEKNFEERKQQYQNYALGISFSNQNMLFAELNKSEGAIVVRKFGAIPTNMKFGSGVEGVEKNVRDLNAYLNGCLVDNSIRSKRLNLSLNTQLVTLHKAQNDDGCTDSEFESYVNWEFGQHIVEGADQYIINTCNLSRPAEMLLVGVRRRFVDTLKSVLDKSKIDLSCIDVDILCSHATYETNYEKLHDAHTALVEIKQGISTVLICEDFDLQFVYQFPVSSKNPQKAGDLLNQHLDFAMQDFSTERQQKGRVGRVVLCNAMAKAVAPYLEQRFHAEVIDPLIQVRLADEYLPKETAGEGDDDGTEKKSEPVPPADYSMYAECIGAALKLLA